VKRVVLTLLILLLAAYAGGGLWAGATIALEAPDNPVTVTPEDVGLDWEDVIIESDGLSLPGWWIPSSSPRAVLVWAHGGGSNRHSIFWDSLGFYRALREAGISVLTFDQRDHGNAPADNDRLTMGKDESRDVAAAVSWARDASGGELPIVLMGVSMGGASSILALHGGTEVDALILTDPVLNAVDVINNGGWVSYGYPAWLFTPLSWGTVFFQGVPAGDASPLSRGKALSLPILLLQSPDDPVTRATYSRELAASNPNVAIFEAPSIGADDPCINFKGRWGSHASAYLCHPEWTMGHISTFLAQHINP
jgi:fermentation-respiration switch protein FrsA (DUF1100 family)